MSAQHASHHTALLAIEHLSVEIRSDAGERLVLRNVSLAIQRGQTLALVGESGSGKSILAQAIMGLLPQPVARISGGHVLLDGQRIDNDADALQAMRGRRIAMIFQEPVAALNPVQTIGAQLAEVFQLHHPSLDSATIHLRSVTLLERVGITDPVMRLRSYPHQLSGGQCQRVMIAMALAGEPSLLIADEPSTALDAETQQQILALLQQLQQQTGMAVLFITHDLALAAQWCERIAVMQHGQICEQGDISTLLSAPRHAYTRQLLDALQAQAPQQRFPDTAHTAPLLLQVRGLDKSFAPPSALLAPRRPPRQVLHGIDLDIRRGETVALVGASGCGKSTLGRALLMLDPPDRGEITFNGQRIDLLDRHQMQTLRRNLQVVFQDTNESLNPRHTIDRILNEPFEIHRIGTDAERRERISRLLDRVELPADSLARFPHEFSGGQRQRIGIARAIALEPRLLICDEAVSALDVATQAQIVRLLLALQREMDLALLFITHDLHLVRRIADRVLVMHEGRIVESNSTAALFGAPQHEATRRLLAARPAIPALQPGTS